MRGTAISRPPPVNTISMNNLRLLLRFGAPALMLGLQSGIWLFVWAAYYSPGMPRPVFWKGHLLVAALYFAILLLISGFYGGLRAGRCRASEAALSFGIALVFTNLITWAQVCLIGSAILPVLPILAMTALQWAATWPLAALAEKLYSRAAPPRQILILSSDPLQAERLFSKLMTRPEKYLVGESVSVTGRDMEDIRALMLEYGAVAFCGVPPDRLEGLQRFCFEWGIRAYTVPGIQDILTRGATGLTLFDTPLLLSRNRGLSPEQRIVKRAMDLLIAGGAFAALSPLILLTALAVKLWDGGPVLYRQERLTAGGRPFTLYKFRSMSPDAEKDGMRLCAKNDGRVTKIGKIIRPVRLDELPQLVNILKGDMSVVGPRPERPQITEAYCKDMPQFAYRLRVKAGLTGYAQVYGCYDTEPWDKLLMDLIYISGYSPLLDIKIILMTIKTLFMQ